LGQADPEFVGGGRAHSQQQPHPSTNQPTKSDRPRTRPESSPVLG
jgi:hypothetical protein